LDGVRAMAYLPRRAHARMRALEALDSEGEGLSGATAAAAGRTPSAEGALRAIDGVLGRVAAAYCVAQAAEDDDVVNSSSPEQALIARERAVAVRAALEGLSEQERHLVEGHDMQGRQLEELGKDLGISKSWASRMHSRALDKLRRRLQRT
jgi:RNA polymerase sigma factor for flagellar operon FliA